MTLSSAPLLINLLLFAALLHNCSPQQFKCSSSAQCHALIDYVTTNSTTYSAVKTLFSIKNLRSILGANNLNLSTSPSQIIPAKQTIKIPFPCKCSNGTGISNKIPIYTVKPDDGLDHIARDLFSGLVTFQQIAAVNKIKDPNVITVGEELQIPLPCSCDDVDGEKVVHYGHVVEAGSTLELIAAEYGTTRTTLMKLNSIANDSSLLAGQVLDVPLKACNSSINTNSIDYPLLVPDGTYTFTANGCVKCKCDSANNWTLECEPSELKPAPKTWSTCPSAVQCNGSNLLISNTTTTGCNTTTCSYAGFNNQTILTALTSLSTCSATVPDSGNGDNNYASSSGFSWNLFLLISIPLIMLSVHL